MSYIDRLRPGSFRGVPFFTPSHEREGGRRGAVHEYPGSDQHTTQDLGQSLTRFTVTAVVMGPDYDVARNRLINALEAPGAGRLVHRYYGEFDAELEPGKTYRITESEAEGGKAVFQIPFIRASKTKAPQLRTDVEQTVRRQVLSARETIKQSFVDRINIQGPEYVREALVDRVVAAAEVVSALNRKVTGALAITNGVQSSINLLSNNVATLVASPTTIFTLAENIIAIQVELYASIIRVAESARATAAAFRGTGPELAAVESEARKLSTILQQSASALTALDGGDTLESTSTEEQMAENDRATDALFRQSAAIEAALAALSIPYDSSRTATATRAAVTDALRELADAATTDDVYAGLLDLAVSVGEYIALALGALPQASQYVPSRSMPALLLAHIVHGDARLHESIVARNNIRHPGFVPAAEPVEVLDA